MVPIIFKVILSVSWCSCCKNIVEASKIVYSSDILISNFQFPIFNFPIFIFLFQSGITGIFFLFPKRNVLKLKAVN